MTDKPKSSDEPIEMEAMDLEEWERDQHTPQQAGEKQSELVKQTAAAPPTPPSTPRKTQTIARTVTRNAGAGLPTKAQTPPAGIPRLTAKIPASAATPAGGVPAPAGQPIARITPTKMTPPTGTQALPRTTLRTPAAGVGVAKPAKPSTPAAGVKKLDDGIDPDTEGWSLPDDDLSVPVEQPKVVAPKPRLDALQAASWQPPDSVIEDPPMPPSAPPRAKTDPPVRPTPPPSAMKTILGAGPAVEDPSSPFAATTSDGTAALEDDLPVAIAPLGTPPFDPNPQQSAPAIEIPAKRAPTPPPVIDDAAPNEELPTKRVPTAPVAQVPSRRTSTPAPIAQRAPTPPPIATHDEPPAKRAPTPLPLPPEPIAEAIAEALAPPYPATLPSPAPPSRELFEAEEATSAREQRAVKTDTFAVARPRSKKPLVLALAAVIVVAIVIFVVTRKKSPDEAARSTEPATVAVVDKPNESAPPTAETPLDAAPVEPPPVAPTPTEADTPTTNPTNPANPTTTPTGPRPLRGKGRGKTPKTVAVVEEPAAPTGDGLADARAAYDAGNKALYKADATGAIAQFQAALRSAPGFAAAHRGLGLAYSLAGDRARALTEFKAYLAASPGARDTQKIQDRITALQALQTK